MASKITPQNLIDLQFVAEQFNTTANFTVFLQAIIDNQEALLAGRLGDTVFNSAVSAVSSQVKRASLCICAAELLGLRINRISGNIDPDSGMLIRTLQAAQTNYLKEAEDKIARVLASGASADSANYAGGVVTTSGSDEDLVPLWPI